MYREILNKIMDMYIIISFKYKNCNRQNEKNRLTVINKNGNDKVTACKTHVTSKNFHRRRGGLLRRSPSCCGSGSFLRPQIIKFEAST